jgi:hypothetical protein
MHSLPLYDIFIIIHDGASYKELSDLIGMDCSAEGWRVGVSGRNVLPEERKGPE